MRCHRLLGKQISDIHNLGKSISLMRSSLQGKPIFTKESILRLCDPTPTILLLFVGTRYLRTVIVGSIVEVESQSRRINSFVKIGFPCNELPFNEIEFLFNSVCLLLLPKKPMATHQASINIQEPTKFKLEATRSRVTLPP